MVGHTGVYAAIKEALKTVDYCVKEVTETAIAKGYTIMLTADHGNADFVVNDDGSPNTAHSCNPVPCFLINSDYKKITDGKLCDIAPTLLTLMGIEVPKEMTGTVLIK
jgi:2,3-bisphosphoglycerate-independent phosphoglycerate mutase